MSLSATVSEKANLIWAIADKLTGTFKPHQYGEIILPMTVLRRFDNVLADSKEAVLKAFEQYGSSPLMDAMLNYRPIYGNITDIVAFCPVGVRH